MSDLRNPTRDVASTDDLLKATADTALAAGREIQNAAAEVAQSTTEALKGHASDFMDAAKDIASQAGNRLQEKVTEQKGAGADYVNNLAGTMRRAASEFESDIPLAATYIRQAASQVESAGDALREGNFNDLLTGAQSFARNQPTAFLGLSVLAGFGIVRFLKSSSGAPKSRIAASAAGDRLADTYSAHADR
jgi:hypothetical protein